MKGSEGKAWIDLFLPAAGGIPVTDEQNLPLSPGHEEDAPQADGRLPLQGQYPVHL